MSNPSIVVKRLVWKELFQIAPLVGIMIGIAIVMIGGTWFLMPVSQKTDATIFATIGVCCFFSVAIATILFAQEAETKTLDFLRNLPIRPASLGCTKLLLGLATVLLFTSAVKFGIWPVWNSFQNRFASFENYNASSYWIAVILPSIEFFLWTALFSITFRSSIHAALLGMLLAASIPFFSCVAIHGQFDLEYAANIWRFRMVVVALLFLLTTRFSFYWSSISRAGNNKLEWGFPEILSRMRRLRKRSAFRRLLWQSWRHLNLYLLWIPILILVTFAAMQSIGSQKRSNFISSFFNTDMAASDVGFLSILACSVLVAIGLLTSLTFSADQINQSKNFFIQHHEHPRLLWLARNVVWVSTFVVLLAFTCLILWIAWSWISPFYRFYFVSALPYTQPLWPFIELSLIGAFGAFGIGQLCSMYVRQPLIACIVSIPLVILFALWMSIMHFLMLEFYWSVVPIIIGCFVATWWAAPDWLANTNLKKYWLKPIATVALPFILICCAIPYARIAQIPEVDIADYSQEDYRDKNDYQWHLNKKAKFEAEYARLSSPAAMECADLYQSAIKAYRGFDPSKFEPFSFPVGLGLRLQWHAANNQFDVMFGNARINTIEFPVDLYVPANWPDKVLNDFVSRNKKSIDLLDRADQMMDCYPFQKRRGSVDRLSVLYLARSEQKLRNSDLSGALQHLLAGITALLRANPEENNIFSTHRILQFLNRLGTWSEHADQNPKQLRAASRGLLQHYNKGLFGTLDDTSVKGVDQGLWLVRFDHRMEQLENQQYDSNDSFRVNWHYRFPWERRRAKKLAKLLAALESGFAKLENQNRIRNIAPAVLRQRARMERIGQLMKSSAIRTVEFSHVPVQGVPRRQLVVTLLLKMELIRYRLQNGKYPDNLLKLNLWNPNIFDNLLYGFNPLNYSHSGVDFDIMYTHHYVGTNRWEFREFSITKGQPFIMPYKIPRPHFQSPDRTELGVNPVTKTLFENPKIWILPKDSPPKHVPKTN